MTSRRCLGGMVVHEPISENLDRAVEHSLLGDVEDRRQRLSVANHKPEQIAVVTRAFRRNPDVIAEVLFRADGICESCRRPAPFKRIDGRPYLEVHHHRPLADGGDDTVENAIALCPNCHRERHHGANFATRRD
ncbi:MULTISPECIES: HNH endonuclease signature motif containing protein [unclassified Paraburkholderia]|uniref:HNH endonuclease n=1 Tax=unclassified Paraburkholderia TaxID=2615204 RepID=UPI0016157140|nr:MULTISPECIES: HNH endonuclease signature motif containing protein [unclassified Paraburkholderia]